MPRRLPLGLSLLFSLLSGSGCAATRLPPVLSRRSPLQRDLFDFSWIRDTLVAQFPEADLRVGIDLNDDGRVTGFERIEDFNRDGFRGDGQDWRVWVQHYRAYQRQNPEASRRLGGMLEWGSYLRLDNPIHELLWVESPLFPGNHIRQVYGFLENLLTQVRQIVRPEDPPQVKMEKVYQLLFGPGTERAYEVFGLFSGDVPFLAAAVEDHNFDCDTAAYLLLAIGHELGWPVHGVAAPGHFFVRWDDGRGTRVNIDTSRDEHGPRIIVGTGDAEYMRMLEISPLAVTSGAYLTNLSRRQLLSQMLTNRAAWIYQRIAGEAFFSEPNFVPARPDTELAVALDPRSVRARYLRARLNLAEERLEEGLEDYNRVITLDPGNFQTLFFRARLHQEMDNGDAAREDLTRILRNAPHDSEWYQLAYHALGRDRDPFEPVLR